MRPLVVAAIVSLFGVPARADIHGSVGAGGALVLSGDRGDRTRADVAFDLTLRGRFGVIAAWRGFDDARRGLVMAGVAYEAAASRPRLVLDFHAAAGADLDARVPLVGGGLRTTVALIGPVGVVLDMGAYLVLDGIDDSRLQLQSALLAVARW